MSDAPFSLDALIAAVLASHPEGDSLIHLIDAVVLADHIEDLGDALIGHFVDQARRSGASWSQIGASLGVTKQAAQKRFVAAPAIDDTFANGRLFSRFTIRARNAVTTAQQLAEASGSPVGVNHLVHGTLADDGGLAAAVVHDLGTTVEAVDAAFPLPTGPGGGTGAVASLSPPAVLALEATVRAALRMGHNYIGTEHLLLGVLDDVDAAVRFAGLGVGRAAVEVAIADRIARIVAVRGTPAT